MAALVFATRLKSTPGLFRSRHTTLPTHPIGRGQPGSTDDEESINPSCRACNDLQSSGLLRQMPKCIPSGRTLWNDVGCAGLYRTTDGDCRACGGTRPATSGAATNRDAPTSAAADCHAAGGVLLPLPDDADVRALRPLCLALRAESPRGLVWRIRGRFRLLRLPGWEWNHRGRVPRRFLYGVGQFRFTPTNLPARAQSCGE